MGNPFRGSHPVKDRTWALVILLVGVAIAALFLTLFWPRLQGARWVGRLTQCRNNLSRIELALWQYHDKHGTYPPAVTQGPDGKPWHSWRVLILAHTEDGKGVYDRYRFDEPWDGPHNRGLVEDPEATSFFRCPTEYGSKPTTSYVAVVGEHTLWPPNRGCRRGEVLDGADVTLHVVEFSNSGIAWSEPRDLHFQRQRFAVQRSNGDTIRSRHPTFPYVAFADGTVMPIAVDTPPDMVKSMLLRDDGGPRKVP